MLTAHADRVNVARVHVLGAQESGHKVVVLRVLAQLLGVVGAPAVAFASFVYCVRYIRIGGYVNDVDQVGDARRKTDVRLELAQTESANI